ncbi:(Lyso)-N-acylphosphatidylethanolamine lipase [Geodia barretti]|uniref:(Lyso)-N-acylphosphatidylethanolamine lipase n=5 Tax=Geodia barretti TaxID=519541 RepID=A0AA35WGA3_GEOBA|nr:(Lyso)-N-acylphosphatidylethanolamine lipase [Geodia barretti]
MSCAATETTVPSINGERRRSWMSDWLPSWRPTSEAQLEEAEKNILSSLSSEYRDLYVPIGEGAVIRCLVMEPQEPSFPEKTPLVLIHGFGCGIVQFFKNLDHLHRDRRLYALDLPGFARSTRIPFPEEAEAVEAAFVSALERWREGVGLERFVLLGHSLGGFLSLSYSMTHPYRVRHLILDDPWGLVDPIAEEELQQKYSLLFRSILKIASRFKPFDWIRGTGPLGPHILRRSRRDLGRVFREDFLDYVYHSNVQNPTGEEGYFCMQHRFAWAKRPMLHRIGTDLNPDLPVSIIYGARSWVYSLDKSVMELFSGARPEGSYVGTYLVDDATHHVHAHKPEEFNETVREILEIVDSSADMTYCRAST